MAGSARQLCPNRVYVVELPNEVREMDSLAGMHVFLREDWADQFITLAKERGEAVIDHGELPLHADHAKFIRLLEHRESLPVPQPEQCGGSGEGRA